MGKKFTLPFQNLATNGIAGNWMTLAGLVCPNTAGYRAALLGIFVGPAGDGTPQDVNVDCMLIRTNNAGAGTPGSTPTPSKVDSGSTATLLTAGLNYPNGLEPSAFETLAMHNFEVNGRGGYTNAWDFLSAIKWGINQTLCLRAEMVGVSVAVKLSGWLMYEEW